MHGLSVLRGYMDKPSRMLLQIWMGMQRIQQYFWTYHSRYHNIPLDSFRGGWPIYPKSMARGSPSGLGPMKKECAHSPFLGWLVPTKNYVNVSHQGWISCDFASIRIYIAIVNVIWAIFEIKYHANALRQSQQCSTPAMLDPSCVAKGSCKIRSRSLQLATLLSSSGSDGCSSGSSRLGAQT